MNTEKNEILAQGLHHLMSPGNTCIWKHLDECNEFVVQHLSHPFGLSGPPHRLKKIIFVGASYNQQDDMTVVVFLANIRFWIGLYGGHEVTGLRIISTPFHDGDPNHHYVFFEVRNGGFVIISGETTDFPEGTRHNMLALESVFAVLSQIYSINIERVSAKAVRLADLYQDKAILA
jgi:hypothetical protein